jgi:hypothetical protein
MYRLKRASVAPFGSCTDRVRKKTRLGSSVSDPDSIRYVNSYPDPGSESGSGSRWTKLPTNVEKNLEKNFAPFGSCMVKHYLHRVRGKNEAPEHPS